MLTLTRKVGQKILIGDNIEIIVREVRGRQVRLGIVAPDGVPVYREELYEQLRRDGRQSLLRKRADGEDELPDDNDGGDVASDD